MAELYGTSNNSILYNNDITPTFSTENTGMIAGLGKASQLVTDNIDGYKVYMKEVRDYLESQLEVS